MIVFDLKCDQDHGFEVWFRDSATCQQQLAAGAVPCPSCGSVKVQKALMAPNLAGARKKNDAKPSVPAKAALAKASQANRQAADLRRALAEVRKTVEENFDYVGADFPEEARKIHYNEAEARAIYGETSPQEAEELADEGIEVSAIPWLPRENS